MDDSETGCSLLGEEVGEILLQDEEITFQLLRRVNDLVFPGELGYQKEIHHTRSHRVSEICLFSFIVAE